MRGNPGTAESKSPVGEDKATTTQSGILLYIIWRGNSNILTVCFELTISLQIYQGRATASTGVVSKFQITTQNGKLFLYSLYVTFLCDYGVLKSFVVTLVKPI